MPRVLFLVLFAAPLATAAQDTAAGQSEPGTAAPAGGNEPCAVLPGVYVGAGIGGGTLSSSHDGGATAFRFRFGAARSSRVSLGFEGGFADGHDSQLSWYDVAVTFHPWERYFYVRGGVGLTTLEGQRYGSGFALPYTYTERGPNVLAGIGLALGRRRGANVTVNLEAQYHRPSGGYSYVQDALSTTAWLGFEWR